MTTTKSYSLSVSQVVCRRRTQSAFQNLSIAEAMERLPVPAVRVRRESSPNLMEIVCHVLVNDSHGIIGGHLSVNSSQLGYQIGIEVRVSLEVGDKILSSLQEEV